MQGCAMHCRVSKPYMGGCAVAHPYYDFVGSKG